MIIERLAKFDRPKRMSTAVLAVLVLGYICYFVVTRGSVVKLKAANVKHAGIEAVYASTEQQQAGFSSLQKQFEGKQKQLQEYQQSCFSNTQAVQFFENINSMALACNLKPVSRAVSEPENLTPDSSIRGEADDEKPETQQQFLKTQSAMLIVSGNYFDIVDFMNELADRPQKVCITNLNITLQVGEGFNPRASFKVTILIDSSKGQEQ